MNYQIKNLKTLRGREGWGYTGALYLDDRKIADVEDFADGGPPYVLFDKPADHAAFMAFVAPDQTDANERQMALEGAIAKMADDADVHARAVKMIKNKVVFTLDGRSALALKAKPSPDAFAHVRKLHPTARFLRDMPEAEAVKLLTGGA